MAPKPSKVINPKGSSQPPPPTTIPLTINPATGLPIVTGGGKGSPTTPTTTIPSTTTIPLRINPATGLPIGETGSKTTGTTTTATTTAPTIEQNKYGIQYQPSPDVAETLGGKYSGKYVSDILAGSAAPGSEITTEELQKTTQKPKRDLLEKAFFGTLEWGPTQFLLKPFVPAFRAYSYIPNTIISAEKEVSDIFNRGDASFGDFVKQLKDPTYGFGTAFPTAPGASLLRRIPKVGETTYKYTNRLWGGAGDIFSDPITYLSAGGSVLPELLAEGATRGILKQGAREVLAEAGKQIIKEAPELVGKEALDHVVPQITKDALKTSVAEAEKVITEQAVKDLGRSALTAQEKQQIKQVARAIAQQDVQRVKALAEKTLAESTDKAEQAAIKQQLSLINKSQRIINQKLSSTLPRKTLQTAQNNAAKAAAIDEWRQSILNATGGSAAEQAYRETVGKVITDQVIKDVAQKGLAGLTDEAANVLGKSPGIRFGATVPSVRIPGTPDWLRTPGFSARGTILPSATKPIGTILEKGAAAARNKFWGTKVGQVLLQNITGAREGGLLTREGILDIKTNLIQGGYTPEEAVKEIRRLAQDDAYRAAEAARAKASKAASNPILRNPEYRKPQLIESATATEEGLKGVEGNIPFKTVYKFLEVPESEWQRTVGRLPTEAERSLIEEWKKLNAAWQEEFKGAAQIINEDYGKLLASDVPVSDTYLQRVVSDKGLEWLKNAARQAQGRGAKEVADALGIDIRFLEGNFTPKALKPGDTWFGKQLTYDDLVAGVDKLNQIAKDSGLIKFDFFTTDLAEIIAKRAQQHAKDMALLATINSLAGQGATSFKFAPAEIISAAKPEDLAFIAETTLSPTKLLYWSPRDLEELTNKFNDIINTLSKTGEPIFQKEFSRAVEDLNDFVRTINKNITSETTQKILADEANLFADAFKAQMKTAKDLFEYANPKGWRNIKRMVDEGFSSINAFTTPGIAIEDSVRDLYRNLNRLDNPKFASEFGRLLQQYNTFFKSYATLSPGFHIRNTFNNAFTMLAAGAIPTNIIEAIKVNSRWNKFITSPAAQKALAADPLGAMEGLVNTFVETLPPAQREVARLAIEQSGVTGFGRVGEAFAGAGQRPGIFGGAPKTELGARLAYGKVNPLAWSRDLGTWVEDHSRFALTYDGIKQGYSPVEASARTAKYLIDYQNLTNADPKIMAIQPFWLWSSRNLPLQIQNMWLNPRAYRTYDYIATNLEDKEGTSPYLPDYLKEEGAFKLPGGKNIYIAPDLGFPGAGKPSLLENLLTDPRQLLSGITPPLRLLAELPYNVQSFSGAPVTKDSSSTKALDRLLYALKQGVPALGTAGRIAGIIPGVPQLGEQQFFGVPEFGRALLGTKKVTSGEQEAAANLQSLLSYIGSPVFNLRPEQEKAEIWRQVYEIAQKAKVAAEEQRRKDELQQQNNK